MIVTIWRCALTELGDITANAQQRDLKVQGKNAQVIQKETASHLQFQWSHSSKIFPNEKV